MYCFAMNFTKREEGKSLSCNFLEAKRVYIYIYSACLKALEKGATLTLSFERLLSDAILSPSPIFKIIL